MDEGGYSLGGTGEIYGGGGASILINVKVVRPPFRACSDSINVFFYTNCEFSMNFHIFFV